MAVMSEQFCTPGTSEGCGQGMCNSAGNQCACEVGYEFDNTQLLFPNCYLSTGGRIATMTTFACMYAATVVLALWVRRGKFGMPKRLCEVAIASGVCGTAQMIALVVERKPGIAATMFGCMVNILCGCVGPFLLLWTLVSPSLDLMMLHSKHRAVLTRMIILVALFTLNQIGVFGAALAYQYQGDYVRFNIIVSAQFAFVGVYALVWAVAIKYYASVLFRLMDALQSGSGSDDKPRVSTGKQESASRAKINAHRTKLGLVVSMTLPLCLMTTVMCLTFSILYFALGVHPYRVAVFIVYNSVFPAFNIILTFFAAKRNVRVISSVVKADESNNTGSKDQVQQAASDFSRSNNNENSSSPRAPQSNFASSTAVVNTGGFNSDGA